MTLIAHLGDDFEFLLGAHEDLRFFESMRQRFFDIDVLAE